MTVEALRAPIVLTLCHTEIGMGAMEAVTNPQGRAVCIVADDREATTEVCERLSAMPDVRLQIRHLKVGDFEVEGEWIFERKTVRDFALSLVDGRLFTQACGLVRYPGGRALILEGSEDAVTGVSREAWQGALISLSLVFQLPVVRSEDPAETSRLLRYAARQAGRERDRIYIPARRRPRGLDRQKVRVLAALPGVGAHRAQQLLNHFGSIEAVILAEAEDLTEVRGIGPHTAHTIRRVVGAGANEGRTAEAVGT
jgi:DNA excision repair protein ERCC-4